MDTYVIYIRNITGRARKAALGSDDHAAHQLPQALRHQLLCVLLVLVLLLLLVVVVVVVSLLLLQLLQLVLPISSVDKALRHQRVPHDAGPGRPEPHTYIYIYIYIYIIIYICIYVYTYTYLSLYV